MSRECVEVSHGSSSKLIRSGISPVTDYQYGIRSKRPLAKIRPYWKRGLLDWLKMVASVAKCLLGERSLQFFRFRGPRCVGQRDLYPFAILFRELPVDRHEELIRRAMSWPDPLADQIARVLKR
jgi:hypothetical protein